MAWSEAADRKLYEAMDADDLPKFRKLLEKHAGNLRLKDGRETWLKEAAGNGKLPFVEFLVAKGIDVNESNSSDDPQGAQGAIVYAASNGHLDVVRWLLDHGARINHVVNGNNVCYSLFSAASNGYLDIVKLLVERGANIHAHENGMNALMRAQGRPEIQAYLRSVGARDLRETTAADYAGSHAKIAKILADFRGPLGKWEVEVPGEPRIVLRQTQATKQNAWQSVFTLGTSDKHLTIEHVERPVEQDGVEFELTVRLPKTWKLDAKSLVDPRWNWPVEWLKRIAREIADAGRTSHFWWSIHMNGKRPKPLAEGTELCGWVRMMLEGAYYQMPDTRWVGVCDLVPIHADERKLIETKGHEAFARRLHARGLPTWLDPQRPSVAGDPEPET